MELKRRKRFITLAVALAVLGAGLTATAISAKPTKRSAGSIEVLSLWGGSEKDAFLKVTAAFTAKTGIKVDYTSARDFIPEIRTRLAAGNPPEIGILPRPGYITTLAKQGALKTLSSLGLSNAYMKGNYSAGWLKLGSSGGKLYGVPAKANSKSVIWYKPDSFKKYHFKVPKTWAQLLALTKKYKAKGLVPWAVGAGPSQSQWTLTDWFENIYARTAGPAKYQALFTGKLKFTDPSVANAAKIMTQIINNKYVLNGVQGVLGQSFVGGIGDVFGTSAKAQLYFEGGFVGGIALQQVNKNLKPGKTIGDFPWPTIKASLDHPVVGAADFAAAFKDTPEVRQFLKYISTGPAGRIWVSTGAVTSPNKKVPASVYPSSLVRAEVTQLATAKTFLFDGSDLLPGAFGDTWGFALQDVIQHPSNIKSILSTFQGKIQGQF
ncbi:MAG: carbohydrate ABC transporter substrate-binding protein [Actinobacteria bacterium]|nr:MAG: carbohydrate ABC transporter substrate-binding protein [Actinomycetota bacterium]